MTKNDMISAIYKKLNKQVTKKLIEEVYDMFIKSIEDEIKEASNKVDNKHKQCIKIPGIGTLTLSKVPSKVIRCKFTKSRIKISEHTMISLKASNNLKDIVNNNK